MARENRRRTGWPKLIAGNLLVLAALLLLVCAVGEVYYRYVFDSTDSFGLTRVCKRWFQRHFQFNRTGFRDNIEYAVAIAPGKRRVTFLGDSFTAGHGIADVDRRFANLLRKSGGDAREIHVIAANGWDTGAEVEAFANLAESAYQMDTVVLVYVLNDISDLVAEWQDILRRIYGQEQTKNLLLDHSYFLNTTYYRIKAATDPDVSDYYGFVRGAYEGPEWERQKERLRQFVKICRSRNARLLVVTFPFLHALGEGYEYAGVHRNIGEFWKNEGIPHLDLLALYEGHRPGELVIGNYDAHPNEFAHELAAGAIGAFIEEHMR